MCVCLAPKALSHASLGHRPRNPIARITKLVAEDVEQVNPDLIVRDKEGKPYSVRYDQVNAMLLNEFLKEHRTVKEQGATIAQLKKEITSLIATVKGQAAQIQQVSAQVQASKAAPQVVVNKP